jgi:hypothetical protein
MKASGHWHCLASADETRKQLVVAIATIEKNLKYFLKSVKEFQADRG